MRATTYLWFVLWCGVAWGQRAASSVSGRLGEWIELAGTRGASARDDRDTASASRQRGSDSRHIWVKVDEVQP